MFFEQLFSITVRIENLITEIFKQNNYLVQCDKNRIIMVCRRTQTFHIMLLNILSVILLQFNYFSNSSPQLNIY